MRRENSALVILNGETPSDALLFEKWEQYPIKICADGAANFIFNKGLVPDYVIGDLDSISSSVRAELSGKGLIHVMDQNTTDGEKIIYFCQKKNIFSIEVLGALGNRFDHSLYNIELLRLCWEKEINVRFITDYDEIFLFSKQNIFSGEIGRRISLFPLFGKVRGVVSNGLKYPLSNEVLEMGIFSSISNELSSTKAVVSMSSGFLLAVIERSAD